MANEGILFTLKEINYSPQSPKMKQPISITGKIDLFKIPFLLPVWVIVTVTYPERWWEEIIPIIGSPEVREMSMAVGGDFEVEFTKGFDREGEYSLAVRAYAGPTLPIDKMTLPPFPPVSSEETTFTVTGEVPPAEEIAFSLTKPAVSPATTVEPGTAIKISCPVTSQCGKQQNITVKCIIYEGSILPGHGAKLGEYTSAVTSITPGQTKTFEFSRSTVAGTIDRRDVQVEVYISGKLVKQSEWDDVYYVGQPPEEVIDFNLARPSVTPATITPGTAITITCPVTSACTKAQTPTAKVIIYEGSILAGHGTKVAEYTSPTFTIAPNQTFNVIVHHTAIAGTIDRRDIEVELYIAGKVVKENEWDDVYYVTFPQLETLQVNIDPAGAGSVTTGPAPSGGTENNWQFPAGATVYVTAHPNPGYTFKSWSGEMTDTSAITAPVYAMTETRVITAHFQVVEAYTLSTSVDPYGGGTVTKSPQKTTYVKGEYVTLTASPASGYEFDYWSGDVSGYSASISVYMDKNKSVVARFKQAIPLPTQLVSFTVKGDGFPFLTSYWKLYHYDKSGNIWQDSTLHLPGDIIRVTNVQSAGYLSSHCVSAVTGEWSEQEYSVEFAAIDGKDYTYDIASGIVYYR